MVTATVARVRFSVFDTSGATDRSSPINVAPVMVAVSLDGMKPFSSALTRTMLRDGNPTPVPHRNALPAMSKPSGLPRNS